MSHFFSSFQKQRRAEVRQNIILSSKDSDITIPSSILGRVWCFWKFLDNKWLLEVGGQNEGSQIILFLIAESKGYTDSKMGSPSS